LDNGLVGLLIPGLIYNPGSGDPKTTNRLVGLLLPTLRQTTTTQATTYHCADGRTIRIEFGSQIVISSPDGGSNQPILEIDRNGCVRVPGWPEDDPTRGWRWMDRRLDNDRHHQIANHLHTQLTHPDTRETIASPVPA